MTNAADRSQMLKFVLEVREPGEGCTNHIADIYNNRGYRHGLEAVRDSILLGYTAEEIRTGLDEAIEAYKTKEQQQKEPNTPLV